jgi:hypothetical protein
MPVVVVIHALDFVVPKTRMPAITAGLGQSHPRA